MKTQWGKIRAKLETQMKVEVDTEFARLEAYISDRVQQVCMRSIQCLRTLFSQAHLRDFTYQGEQQTLKVFMSYLRGNYRTDQIVLAIGHAGFGGI
ncbi:hypothetical protein HDU79_011524 [Rhizoclosmatium sp. JEL0117]|nr:hypothetical protein HDU79_011524 [Rhizoclosmatium sp. JEL0117]